MRFHFRLTPNAATAGILAALLVPGLATAEIPGNRIRIGVLTDMAGPLSDTAGKGSVVAAQLAAEDFAAAGADGLTVEILSADHQNKPDIGSSVARQWLDQDGVAAITDMINSGVALAATNLLKEKNRAALAAVAASSDLTGKACTPVTTQWVTDTYAQANSAVQAMTAQGGRKWFFLTVDYALGLGLERDASAAVARAGGQVAGSVHHPLGTADYSAYLLQAQSSGADILALANVGTDTINSIKQAAEFGLTGKLRTAAIQMHLSDVHSMGLENAQGLYVTDAFYWNLTDRTRAFARRYAARMNGAHPGSNHAGVYSSTLAFLKAAKAIRTIDGAAVTAEMKKTPFEDPLFGPSQIRADGRVIHPMYLFRVKAPSASKQPWDYYDLVETIPADRAFRPMKDGGCPLVAG